MLQCLYFASSSTRTFGFGFSVHPMMSWRVASVVKCSRRKWIIEFIRKPKDFLRMIERALVDVMGRVLHLISTFLLRFFRGVTRKQSAQIFFVFWFNSFEVFKVFGVKSSSPISTWSNVYSINLFRQLLHIWWLNVVNWMLSRFISSAL